MLEDFGKSVTVVLGHAWTDVQNPFDLGSEGFSAEYRVLRGWAERVRGLLGTQPNAQPVALVECPSVHTFGMRYPIDIALVSAEGRVLACPRGVAPSKVVRALGARMAFERPMNPGPWLREGEYLQVSSSGGGTKFLYAEGDGLV